jgi:hypothetical protein
VTASRSRVAIVALSAWLVGAITVALVVVLTHDHRARHAHVYTAPKRAFAIAYPSGWRALPQPTGVVLRRDDRRAMIVVRQAAAPAGEPLSKLASQLTNDLRRRFTDFKPVAARVATIRGGTAFLYTFARTKVRIVQSIMVARAGGRTWSLYAVTPAGSPAIARQTGQILGTFGQAQG